MSAQDPPGQQQHQQQHQQETRQQQQEQHQQEPQQEAESQQLRELFTFLARIPMEPELRERLNWVQTALEVSEIASGLGHRFTAETLIETFQRCNETPYARVGLMDEKLVRVLLQRQALLSE